MKSLALLFVLLLTGPLYAQLAVPEKTEVGKQITAGCNCILPEGPHDVQFIWRADDDCTLLTYPDIADKARAYIWAPPGKHSLRAVVLTQAYEELEVQLADGTTKLIKLYQPANLQEYVTEFEVTGGGPAPPPPPPPGPADPYKFYERLHPIFQGKASAAQEYAGRTAGLADALSADTSITTVAGFNSMRVKVFNGFAEKYQVDPAMIGAALGEIFEQELGNGTLDRAKCIAMLKALSAAVGRIS